MEQNITRDQSEQADSVTNSVGCKTKVKLKGYDIVSAAFQDAEIEQFENVKNNQDNNEVFGTDVLNAAVELADHQDSNFDRTKNESKIYISQNSSSSENIESVSYELYQKSNRNTASTNSIHIANVQENSEIVSTERIKVGQFSNEYSEGSQQVICELNQNDFDIREEVIEQHVANDNNSSNMDDESPPAMVIRSVTLN